ncbi:uncharacterized protein JCM6883_004103 [Sporobolomyces salmoneus]|uniref:uncharacterized protein n=1 Tax=Sporobolomyces salmoneus TaxID=183962 RepID=UPI00317B2D88
MPSPLPVELLRVIVDHFRLPPFTSNLRTIELEDECRSALYSLCLTNRVFHQIARPLLYNFVRIPKGKTVETLSLLVKDYQKNVGLSLIETMMIDTDKEERFDSKNTEDLMRLSRKVPTALVAVKHLISYSGFWTLEEFNGTNLSRVFLNNVQIDTEAISGLLFPSIQVLGLYNVFLNPDPLPAASFPALRHLGFDKGAVLDPEDTTTLISLLPQLDSIILMSDVLLEAMPNIPSLPFASVLVNHAWDMFIESRGLSALRVVFLRLLIASVSSRAADTQCGSLIDSFAGLLKDPHQFTRLELIYLPSLDALPSQYREPDIIAAIEKVSLAAKDRGILVMVEDQSEQLKAECQISEDFMRRMTQKRIEEEVRSNLEK